LNDREFCRIDLLRGRRKAAYDCEIEPGLLRLLPKSGKGNVELLLLGPGNVRIRATDGLGLRLSVLPKGANVAFTISDSFCTLNVRSARRRFQVESLTGSQELDAPWGEVSCKHMHVYLEPDASGMGEWAIDGYTSTWIRPRRTGFDVLKARVRSDYEKFCQGYPDGGPRLKKAHAIASLVNWSCLVSPYGKFKHEAMLMSKGWMDQVWSWDNCFNAMALAEKSPKLAMEQLMVVIDRQDAHGCYPDAMNDVHEHTCFNKPPVWGIAVREMIRRNPRYFIARRLVPVYDSMARFLDWWLEHRRLPGRRLCYYLHGNDSGWDNSTQFDEGVPLEAPDLNAFLITQAEVLAELAGIVGKKGDASRFKQAADDLTQALLGELWDGDRFVGLKDGRRIRSESLIPCMPLVLGERLPEDIRKALVGRVRRHLTEWGLATEHPDSPKYSQDGYWRGPIWGPSTVLICLGLERSGEVRLAKTIGKRFAKLCTASGFAENYDALTGAPLRDPAYSWTASAFLFLTRAL
jgi:glycogen debranching enzyme